MRIHSEMSSGCSPHATMKADACLYHQLADVVLLRKHFIFLRSLQKQTWWVVLNQVYFLSKICMFPDEMEKDQLAKTGDESFDEDQKKAVRACILIRSYY